jgi:hypothetical protein
MFIAHPDRDADSHSVANSFLYAYANCDSYTYTYFHCYVHPQGHAYTALSAITEASSDSRAETIKMFATAKNFSEVRDHKRSHARVAGDHWPGQWPAAATDVSEGGSGPLIVDKILLTRFCEFR